MHALKNSNTRSFPEYVLLTTILLSSQFFHLNSTGLGTVYAINIVLAILASFKAGERGQPALLWVAKTFTVGGLAYDQLTQLPTLEQVEEMKARKGKRALSKQKKDSLNKYNN